MDESPFDFDMRDDPVGVYASSATADAFAAFTAGAGFGVEELLELVL